MLPWGVGPPHLRSAHRSPRPLCPWSLPRAALLQTNAPILPIMLATKHLPEMEEEEQALLAQLAQEHQGEAGADAAGASAAGGAAQLPAALSIAEQFAWVQDQERELNHLIDQLTREEGSLLGAKGERRKEKAAAVAKTAVAAAGSGAPSAKPAQQQQAQGRPGQQAAEAPDPLLAAVTYGALLSG